MQYHNIKNNIEGNNNNNVDANNNNDDKNDYKNDVEDEDGNILLKNKMSDTTPKYEKELTTDDPIII